MTKKQRQLLMVGGFLVVMLASLVVINNQFGLLQQVPTGTEEEPVTGFYTVDAKIQFTVRNKYNGSLVKAGNIDLYDPAIPGSSIETITITSGVGTSARYYTSGDSLGVLYSGNAAYLSSSWLIEAPYAKSDDASQTLDCDEIFEVVAVPDRVEWGIWIQKAGSDVWTNDSGTAVDAFDPQTDDDDVSMGIRYRNTGDNEGFASAGYFDYSQDNAELQNRKSYWVIRFALNASGTTLSAADLNAYLKFNDMGGGVRYYFGDQVVLFKEITTEIQGGIRDTDSQGNTQGGLTGNAVIWTIEFDFSGGIGNADYVDEILIEPSVVHGFALDYAEKHMTLTQTGDQAEGWMDSDFSNRCTIG